MSFSDEELSGLTLNSDPLGLISAASHDRSYTLTCGGCGEAFTALGPASPQSLSCGHSICRMCAIEKAAASPLPRLLVCPVCTRDSVAPLRPNLLLSMELEKLKGLESYSGPARERHPDEFQAPMCENHHDKKAFLSLILHLFFCPRQSICGWFRQVVVDIFSDSLHLG